MSDSSFDGQIGLHSQQELRRYLKLLGYYESAMENIPPDVEHIARLQADIQSARDMVASRQYGFQCYEAKFYDLTAIGAEELKNTLRHYELYLAELPGDFCDPPFVEHRMSYLKAE